MRVEGLSTPAVNAAKQANPEETQIDTNSVDKINESAMSINEQPQQEKLNEEELINAIESANDSIQLYNRRLQFSIHEGTKEIMVKVIDTKTDKVIREIPNEKILDMVAKLWELAGILVDEKV